MDNQKIANELLKVAESLMASDLDEMNNAKLALTEKEEKDLAKNVSYFAHGFMIKDFNVRNKGDNTVSFKKSQQEEAEQVVKLLNKHMKNKQHNLPYKKAVIKNNTIVLR